MSESLGSLVVTIDADARRFTNAIEGTVNRMGTLQSAALKMGAALSAGVTLPLIGIGTAALHGFTGFNKALASSVASYGAVGLALRSEMAKTARAVSLTSTKSADELASSYALLHKAGYDAASSIKALGIAASFADAHGLSMAESIGVLTQAQKDLGLQSAFSEENIRGLAQTSDQLTLANQKTGRSVQQVGQAIKDGTGQAKEGFNGLRYAAMGATDAMAKITRDADPWARLKNGLDDVSGDIGKELLPKLNKFVDLTRGAVGWWHQLPESTRSAAINVGAVAATMGPVLALTSSWFAALTLVPAAIVLVNDALGNTNTGLLEAIDNIEVFREGGRKKTVGNWIEDQALAIQHALKLLEAEHLEADKVAEAVERVNKEFNQIREYSAGKQKERQDAHDARVREVKEKAEKDALALAARYKAVLTGSGVQETFNVQTLLAGNEALRERNRILSGSGGTLGARMGLGGRFGVRGGLGAGGGGSSAPGAPGGSGGGGGGGPATGGAGGGGAAAALAGITGGTFAGLFSGTSAGGEGADDDQRKAQERAAIPGQDAELMLKNQLGLNAYKMDDGRPGQFSAGADLSNMTPDQARAAGESARAARTAEANDARKNKPAPGTIRISPGESAAYVGMAEYGATPAAGDYQGMAEYGATPAAGSFTGMAEYGATPAAGDYQGMEDYHHGGPTTPQATAALKSIRIKGTKTPKPVPDPRDTPAARAAAMELQQWAATPYSSTKATAQVGVEPNAPVTHADTFARQRLLTQSRYMTSGAQGKADRDQAEVDAYWKEHPSAVPRHDGSGKPYQNEVSKDAMAIIKAINALQLQLKIGR